MGKSKWVMLGVLSCVLSSPAAQAGLIAYLAMDGQDGSQIFTDSQGGAWNAFGSPPPYISTGQSVSGGASAYFDGKGGSVRNAVSSALYFPSGEFTIDFWIYPLAMNVGGNSYLAGRSNPDAGQGFDIRLDKGEILVTGVNGWGFNIGTNGVQDNVYVKANEWGHVVMVATSSDVYLYFNDQLRGTSRRSLITDGNNAFSIGYQSNFGGESFYGYIDEFRVWDSAVRPQQNNPIPEPSSLALMGAGLLGLASLSRKR